MVACESLPNFLEKPLPEINPTTLRQSLSQCKHFNSLEEHPSLSSSSSSSTTASPTSSSSWTSSSFSSSSFSIDFISPLLDNENLNHKAKNENKHCRHGRSFSSVNSCAEDLGDASSKRYRKAGRCIRSHSTNEYESICKSLRSKRSQITGEEFPPPIPSIGRSGKPWVSLKSYKQNGRFILKEVRIPIQEFLHACREDGRLKMQIIQSDEEEDYNDESDQRCDRCSNSDEEYNGQKDLGDEEGECL